jgi:lipopolysaccharide transport system ATP-binding protein
MDSRQEEMQRDGLVIRIRGLKKEYRLGQIGSTTLQAEIKRWWAKKRGLEDPYSKIGQPQRVIGEKFMALNGIDLEIHKGEALGIIGRNGAGKSTLLKIISRITAPTEGEVEIIGRVTSMLEVGTGFHREMTGRENVYLNGAILGMTKAEIDSKMDEIIDFSEVGEFIDTPVKRYSSGMYVKLAFSVAAHLDNEIQIMDEVLAVGDMEFQKKCLQKMRASARVEGRTVLYVSHNMSTIRNLCDRCIVLDEGKIVFDGDVDKAVSLYMGTGEQLRTETRFAENNRPYGYFSQKFLIERLVLKEADKPRYMENSKARFLIECKALQDLKTVCLRMEFWYQDGTKIGSMLSNPVAVVKQGPCRFLLEMDMAGFTSGQYSADLVAYSDENGVEKLLDGVYPGIVFEIINSPDAVHHVVWSHQYWGHIRLRDMRLELK